MTTDDYGWPVSLPDVPRPERERLHAFLVEHLGRMRADRMLDAAGTWQAERDPYVHWAVPQVSPRLRELLQRFEDPWLAAGWLYMRPAHEVPPPIGRRVTPGEAQQIREDVAEEFRGWSGL